MVRLGDTLSSESLPAENYVFMLSTERRGRHPFSLSKVWELRSGEILSYSVRNDSECERGSLTGGLVCVVTMQVG